MADRFIAIDYTPAYEQGGGIGRLTRELIAALAPLRRSAYATACSCPARAAATCLRRLPPRFKWRPTPITPRWFARLWQRARLPLPVEAFTGRVDLYHATDFVLPPTLPRTRTLLTVHDLSFVRVPETASPSLRAYLDGSCRAPPAEPTMSSPTRRRPKTI